MANYVGLTQSTPKNYKKKKDSDNGMNKKWALWKDRDRERYNKIFE